MTLLVEPPRSQARVAGGLLGVAGGEAWRGARCGFETGGPVTAALLDLSRSYAWSGRTSAWAGDHPGQPVDVAHRHEGVPASGWLLPVAMARSGPEMIDEARMLAIAAGATGDVLQASVRYVRLAAELFAGQPADAAIEAATEKPAKIAVTAATRGARSDETAGPRLCGIGPIDALTAGIWALAQAGQRLATLAASLVRWCEPWVAAAAAGLLGIRDGCAAVPAQWHRRIPTAEDCLNLAPRLGADPSDQLEPQPAVGAIGGMSHLDPSPVGNLLGVGQPGR